MYKYASSSEFIKISNVLETSFFGNDNPDINLLAHLFQIGKFCLYVDNNKIVGLVCYFKLENCKLKMSISRQFCDLNKIKNMWYIGYLCVIPEYRGKGVGKQLLEKAISDIIESDKYVEYIGLNSRRQNILAQNLYKTCGFEMWNVCVMNRYENPKDDEIFMYKKLSLSSFNKFVKTILFK